MATTTKLMTAEELLEMPDDGFRYELVRGELVKMRHLRGICQHFTNANRRRLLVFV